MTGWRTAVGGTTIQASSLVEPSSIVVGVDGSNDGLRAVDYAAGEAVVRSTPIHLVTVVPPAATAFGLTLPLLTPSTAAAVAELAAAAAARRALASGLSADRVTTAVVLGQPGDVLAEKSKGAAAVVIGRRGISGLERVFAGSTSVTVGAKASCPVIVVPHGWRPPVAAGRPVGVGIDGSEDSVPALAAAYAEAAERNVDLRVIFAYQPQLDSSGDAPDHEARLADWLNHAGLWVAETIAGWRADYPDVEVQRHFVRAHPARVLVEESSELDLLYVGTNGSSVMSGLVLGTVARAVVAGSVCPVALVRKRSDQASRY